MAALTYAEVGALRYSVLDGEPLPEGYAHLRVQVRLGRGGPEQLRRAGEALLSWQVHRASGVRVRSASAVAEPGAVVAMGVGIGALRIDAPCEVVFVVREPDAIGFGYGSLPGHPQRGEEAFLVELHGDDLWFTVTAFSRPAVWFTRIAGPVLPMLQRAYARRLSRKLRRLV